MSRRIAYELKIPASCLPIKRNYKSVIFQEAGSHFNIIISEKETLNIKQKSVLNWKVASK